MYTSVTGHGCKKWHAPAAHWNVHECYWPWVEEVTRACRTLKFTRVLLAIGARRNTRLPHTEMYTSVTGHGCKKWHAPAAHWNVHECYWPWVQEVARACHALKWPHGRLSTFGSKLVGERSTHHICKKVTKSAKISAIVCDVKGPKKITQISEWLSERNSLSCDRTICEMIFWPLMFTLILIIIIIIMLRRFIRRSIGNISGPSSQYRERNWWWVEAL